MSEKEVILEEKKVIWDLVSSEIKQPKVLMKDGKPTSCPFSSPALMQTETGMIKIKEPCSEGCPFLEVVNEVDKPENVYAKLTCFGKAKLFKLDKYRAKK